MEVPDQSDSTPCYLACMWLHHITEVSIHAQPAKAQWPVPCCTWYTCGAFPLVYFGLLAAPDKI